MAAAGPSIRIPNSSFPTWLRADPTPPGFTAAGLGSSPRAKARFMYLCPDFVVERTSPSDRLSKVQAKMAESIDNGAVSDGGSMPISEQSTSIDRVGIRNAW
jgi:hypothetical protein